jgi:hypothetical protein
MVEFREGECFLTKSSAGTVIGERTFGENLDGYIAVEMLIAGTINHSHSALANFIDDAIVAEFANGRSTLSRAMIRHEKNAPSSRYLREV